jgi:diguanylate cyclase (GGDEF)-like protein
MTETPAQDVQSPDQLAIQQAQEKNRWLVRLRWIYPFFILFFFLAYSGFSGVRLLGGAVMVPLVLLPLVGNVLFVLQLRRRTRLTDQAQSYGRLAAFASLQLDFDLVVLALFVYFSGGLNSPMVLLFVFYVMISTFLSDSRKALRNMLSACVLVTVIALARNPDLIFSSREIATVMAYDILFVFSFFISGYLSRNMRHSEEITRKLLQQAHELSISDGLTGLYNQSRFFELLDIETKKSQRHGLTFTLILFDVDNFKNYNDHNGHIQGSATLKRMGQIMRDRFRATDLLAKYGGDEFVIILPQTDKVGAYLAAERLRESVEHEPFPGGEHQPRGMVTLSLGIAAYPEHGLTASEILDHADKALYAAKAAGRNNAVIYTDRLARPDEEE